MKTILTVLSCAGILTATTAAANDVNHGGHDRNSSRGNNGHGTCSPPASSFKLAQQIAHATFVDPRTHHRH